MDLLVELLKEPAHTTRYGILIAEADQLYWEFTDDERAQVERVAVERDLVL